MTLRILCLFILLSIETHAQVKEGDLLIGAGYTYVTVDGFEIIHAATIKSELMISKRFGAEMTIAGAKDYAQYGIQNLLLPLGIVWSKSGKNKGGGFLLLIGGVLALLEQTNYHIPLSSSMEVVPYLSVLGLRYIYDRENQNTSHIYSSWSLGTKLTLTTQKNWFIQGYAETGSLYYSKTPDTFQAGITLGYIFKNKSEE